MERPRPSSPEHMKAARTVQNIADDFAIAPRPKSPEADGISVLRPNSVYGRNAEERIRNRALQQFQTEQAFEYSMEMREQMEEEKRAASRDRNASTGTLSRPASHASTIRPGSQSLRTPSRGTSRGTSRGGTDSLGGSSSLQNPLADPLLAQHRVDRTPGARLNYENPLAGSTKHLGSSQIIGCQGDFCSFDMSYLENVETLSLDVSKAGTQNVKELSDFRKRLLMTGAGSNFVDANSSVSKMLRTDGQDPRKHSVNSLISEQRQSSTPVADQKVTYRSVIQARQEMPLVKTALENHRKGLNIPYLRDDAYNDIAASMAMASHYYQDVPCCMNCYKVYTIIDKERRKALNRISERRKLGDDDEDDEKPPAVLVSASGKHLFESDANRVLAASYEGKESLEKALTNHQVETLKNLGGKSKGRHKRKSAPQKVDAAPTPSQMPRERGVSDDSSLATAMQAIEGLTKMDVAEIRTMSNPHPAVEVVMEAVMTLLTGRKMAFRDVSRLLGGGEAFLTLLKDFRVEDVTEERLRLVEGYVDHPVFKPEYVMPISLCASKFCAWVHGITHAARHARGRTHERIDTFGRVAIRQQDADTDKVVLKKKDFTNNTYLKPLKRMQGGTKQFNRGENFVEQGQTSGASGGSESFVQKIEKIRANKFPEYPQSHVISRQSADTSGSAPFTANAGNSGAGGSNTLRGGPRHGQPSLRSISRMDSSVEKRSAPLAENSSLLSRSMSRLDPGPSPSMYASTTIGEGSLMQGSTSPKKLSKRESKALKAMQQKSTNRLSAQTASEGNAGLLGQPSTFRCADGITKLPYMVLGKFSLAVSRCSFVVVHDFFDTCDATAILFKPIVARHDGCQVLCFNYPGQAHTVWPRPSAAEKERGAKDPVLSNDWIADRMHELLQFAERTGEILLTSPFHLVGIGNGAAIAAAFCQKYGRDSMYAKGLRSMVSINGFLYPDPQLSSILHSAYQVFESTPHNRPDIPVSYWSRFVFSDEYLGRINPNLALNIYTAVSNPITNEGRTRIARGALQHRDMRGALAPDFQPNRRGADSDKPFFPVQIPVIILQSTENTLVNASNVDPFLIGRNSKHLWSHMLNVPSEAMKNGAYVDVTAQWVGKMSSGPHDYHRYSTLGKTGLKMILESLRNPRGAFSMWTRTGHIVQQEYKGAVLDLLDVLACPTDDYIGLDSIEASEEERAQALLALTKSKELQDEKDREREETEKKLLLLAQESEPPPVDVVFSMPGGGTPGTSSKREVARHSPDEIREEFDVLSLIDEETLKEKPQLTNELKKTDDDDADVELNPDLLKMVDNVGYVKPEKEAESVEEKESESETEDLDPARAEHHRKIRKAAEESASGMSPAPKKRRQGSRPNSGSSRVQSTEPLKDKSQPVAAAPIQLTELYAIQPPDLPPFSDKKEHGRTQHELPLIEPPGPADLSEQLVDTDVVDIDIETDDRTGKKVVKAIKEGLATTYISDQQQRKGKEWASAVPDAVTAMELEAELRAKQQEYLELEARIKKMREEEEAARLSRIDDAQAQRREQYAKEDQAMLKKLQEDLDERQRERDFAEKQRRLDVKRTEEALVAQGIIDRELLGPSVGTGSSVAEPIPEMMPMRYEDPAALPKAVVEGQDVISKLDRMKADEEEARKRGTMTMEEYERVKREMAERQMERDQMLRSLSKEEQQALFEACAVRIQRMGRGYNGRKKAKAAAELKRLAQLKLAMAVKIQSQMRRILAKKRFERIKDIFLNNMKYAYSAGLIQRIYRGHLDRLYFHRLKRWVSAIHIQRTFRGLLGRKAFNREKARLELLRKKQLSAAKIQSVWRMKVAKEEFRSLRIHVLAAIEIQRSLRGYLGRKQVARRRQWESTAPGPERIKLGLEFIEESKQAFERQQEEIDALHRAQERAEARVSHIHAELTESEKELVILERELQEIDQIERDLTVLTHERELLSSGIQDAAGMPRLAAKGHKELVMGKESTTENDPVVERRRKAEAYALEMTIQIKRSEREKKRQELEIEFAAVFQEVQKKKKALERLELALADMEATRERKEREFRRLQKNLMQLLMEQKQELDDLREKGIELETASATTAAAAVATAQKAKEHEARSTAMFSQTEELMKFQFMSMSLSYFSSLNMLKSLRDMNADTTSAAISLSADAAATAAGAAAAANLPNMKKMDMGAGDFVEASIQKKKVELQASKKAQDEYDEAMAHPMPDNVRSWTTSDVARWLDSLALNQYSAAFTEAAVDGPFLMELREEDLVQVLGMKHKLHVRKVMISREKLKPLSQQEMKMKEAVEIEDRADATRNEINAPSLDTVFSQARNGRVKRVEESLNLGFPIDAEDEKGNTLLLVAAQNSNRRLVEMLLMRGADINHQNAQGSTALHFALTFDAEGTLGEYLIDHGADDTIENVDGLTPYDGITA